MRRYDVDRPYTLYAPSERTPLYGSSAAPRYSSDRPYTRTYTLYAPPYVQGRTPLGAPVRCDSTERPPLPPVGPLLASAPSLCIGGEGAGVLSRTQDAYLSAATNTPLDGASDAPAPNSAQTGRGAAPSSYRKKGQGRRLPAIGATAILPALPLRDLLNVQQKSNRLDNLTCGPPGVGAMKITTASAPRNRRPVARVFPQVRGVE